MFTLLKKFWFFFAFIILASISIGGLFGYRISLEEKTLEQRGVLFLEGYEKDITMTLDGSTTLITLPYLNPNLSSGFHTIELIKAGYTPYTHTFTSSIDKAAHLKVEMTPLEERVLSTTFTSTPSLLHTYVNNKILLEYYPESRILSVFEKALSLRIHRPDRVFTLDMLKEKENILQFHSFKDQKILLQTNAHWRICSLDIFTCTILDADPKDEVFTEVESIFRFKPEKKVLAEIHEQTGSVKKTFTENISSKKIIPDSYTTLSKVPRVLFADGSKKLSYLTQDFFGNTNLQPTEYLFEDIQVLFPYSKNTEVLTSSGHTLPTKSSLTEQEQIRSVVPFQNGEFLLYGDGDIYFKRLDTEQFLTRFSEVPRQFLYPSQGLFGYRVFPKEIKHCEKEKLSYCAKLMEIPEFSYIRYNEAEQYFMVYSEKETTVTYHFYFLPKSIESTPYEL